METEDLLDSYDRNLRIDMVFPDMLKETSPQLVRFTRGGPNGRGTILYAWLDETNAAGAIAEQVEYYRTLGLPLEWMVCDHDPYPGLKQQLEAAGFQPDLDPGDPGAVLMLDLKETPPELLAPVQADIRRVEEKSQIQDVIQVLENVYGHNFGWIESRFGAHLAVPGYLSVYLAYAQGLAVCAGWTYFPPGSQWASLWGGSTVPSQRRRGYYLAVLAARVQEALRRGRRFLVVYAGLESRPILEKHGFRLLTYASSYEWTPPQQSDNVK